MSSEQHNHGASMKENPQPESATGRHGSAKFKSPVAVLGALMCVLALAGCLRSFIKYDPPDELAGWQYQGGLLWKDLVTPRCQPRCWRTSRNMLLMRPKPRAEIPGSPASISSRNRPVKSR